MPELGIETASDDASVAVMDGDRVLAERRWHIETTASRELLAGIKAVLLDAGVERTALTGIAVDVGPGGYGSLRTAVATAQGLALALDVPLAAVDRLEVQAFPHLQPDGTVIAVHEAGRAPASAPRSGAPPGEGPVLLAWAAFGACILIDDARTAPPEVRVAPRLDPADQCLALAPSPARWCGDLAAVRTMRDIVSRSGAATPETGTVVRSGDIDVSDEANTRSAADVIRLARLHRAFGDPAAVDVTYLRPPNITVRAAN